MSAERKHTGTFVGIDELEQKHTVNVFTQFITSTNSKGTFSDTGSVDLKTSDGHLLNRISKGVYEFVTLPGVFSERMRLTSDDPNAP
jgi:hypothetical protein